MSSTSTCEIQLVPVPGVGSGRTAPSLSDVNKPETSSFDTIGAASGTLAVSLQPQPQHDQEPSPGPLDSLDARPIDSPASRFRTTVVILQLCTINFLAQFSSGVVTVCLPVIADSVSLQRSLYLWPTSVYSLTSGATLLIAGSVADLIGPRKVDLTGSLLIGVFTVACGFAQTGVQLVVFRALEGVATSLHLPASVGLVAAAVPAGKSRNIGFASLGMAQPLGFSVGLVLSGIMVDKVGWRVPFYLSGAMTILAAIAGFWALPASKKESDGQLMKHLWTKIDWIGGGIAGAGLTILSYVLATLSASTASITHPTTASLLSISLLLLALFPLWMHRQHLRNQPQLIPNTLWCRLPFTSTCLMVALSSGVLDSLELFSSLYFQEIQHTSPLGASLRLLPDLLVGAAVNLTIGFVVHRLPARWLVAISSLICAAAPLLMALTDPKWSFWYTEFWAQALSPLSGDVLFTVGLVIVSEVFPEEMQGVAGAVFNTVSRFGQSLGVNGMQVVSLAVAGRGAVEEGEGGGGGNGNGNGGSGAGRGLYGMDRVDLLRGYRASFWAMFGCMVLCVLIAVGGLRKAGKVGLKRE